MKNSLRIAARSLLAALVLCVLAGIAQACTVPVFRYALERWEPDPYLMVVYHAGPADQQVLDFQKAIKAAADADPTYANIAVETFDVDSELEGWPKRLWEIQQEQMKQQADGKIADSKDLKAKLPRAILKFPFRSGIERDLWVGKPDADAVKRLIDSPVRREVARRLLKGESAVWVLLESGDSQQDTAAEKSIQQELARLQKELKLPELAEEDRKYLSGDGPELKVKFSVLRMSRDDPQETLFRELLLLSEPDLKSEDFDGQPMVFPVFGRGRVLWGLVGKGINKDTLEESCTFLTGACSCQVKELNPGTDLLMAAGWENLVTGQFVIDEELPPLTGLPSAAEMVLPTKTSTLAAARTSTAAAAGESEKSTNPLIWVGLVMCIGVGLLALGTAAMKFKQAEQ